MAPVKITPIKLPGPWAEGYVLDLHTISSTFLGYDGSVPRFDTKYTELGELVYRFKYRSDSTALPDIVDTIQRFLEEKGWKFDCILAVPPSIVRKSQPVTEMAKELSSRLGIPVCDDAVVKMKTTPPMKNIEFPAERAMMLRDAFQVALDKTRGKHILLLDDLFDYGSTVGAVTNVLLTKGDAAAVYMLTLTRKRT